MRLKPARCMLPGVARSIALPSTDTLPVWKGTAPVRALRNVVFPEPFGPITAVIERSVATKSKSASAVRVPYRTLMPVTSIAFEFTRPHPPNCC